MGGVGGVGEGNIGLAVVVHRVYSAVGCALRAWALTFYHLD